MAGFYQTFTSTRQTEPDPATLLSNLRAQDSTAGVQHLSGSPTYVVKKATDWTPQQITFVQNQIDTCPPVSSESIAQTVIDNMPIFEKALLLTLLDQINVLRAALPTPLAAITPAQAIAAVRTKAGTL